MSSFVARLPQTRSSCSNVQNAGGGGINRDGRDPANSFWRSIPHAHNDGRADWPPSAQRRQISQKMVGRCVVVRSRHHDGEVRGGCSGGGGKEGGGAVHETWRREGSRAAGQLDVSAPRCCRHNAVVHDAIVYAALSVSG